MGQISSLLSLQTGDFPRRGTDLAHCTLMCAPRISVFWSLTYFHEKRVCSYLRWRNFDQKLLPQTESNDEDPEARGDIAQASSEFLHGKSSRTP